MDVQVVPDVTAVLVSTSSVSLSCVMVSLVVLIGNLWNRNPFVSSEAYFRRKR